MNIGINATRLGSRPSGVKQRFLGLYSHLVRERRADKFTVYFSGKFDSADIFEVVPNVEVIRLRDFGNRLLNYVTHLVYFYFEFKRKKFNVFEGQHMPFICPKGGDSVFTIHDIRGLRFKSNTFYRLINYFFLRDAVCKSRIIVTVSATMKRAILEIFPRADVRVVYNGLDSSYLSFGFLDEGPVSLRYNLPSNYILAVGHIEPRKNYGTLLEAYSVLVERESRYTLVIVGRDSGSLRCLRDKIADLGLVGRVLILQDVSEFDLALIYRKARLVVFPSIYEGFGIPVLESMAHGVPILLSNIEVFKEITEDLLTYFDPTNIEDVAKAMSQGLEDEDYRDRCIKYGLGRVRDFSFERITQSYSSILDELGRQGQ